MKKFCTKCRVEKELIAFPKRIIDGTRKNGNCKKCLSILAKQRRLPFKEYWKNHDPYINSHLKRCSTCKRWLQRKMFSKNSGSKDGLDAECKKCSNIRDKQYALQNPEKIKIYRKLRMQNVRDWRLQKYYKLSFKDILLMYEKLQGKCPLCSRKMVIGGNKGDSIHVDHDHITGRVRGLLCSICNRLLGMAKDDPQILLKAAEYLIKNSLLTKQKKCGKVVNINTV